MCPVASSATVDDHSFYLVAWLIACTRSSNVDATDRVIERNPAPGVPSQHRERDPLVRLEQKAGPVVASAAASYSANTKLATTRSATRRVLRILPLAELILPIDTTPSDGISRAYEPSSR